MTVMARRDYALVSRWPYLKGASLFSREAFRCQPLIARCSPCSNRGRAIRRLVPYSRRRASDYAHNSRRAAHASLESMSRLELVTQDAQFEPFKGSESETVVILGVPV